MGEDNQSKNIDSDSDDEVPLGARTKKMPVNDAAKEEKDAKCPIVKDASIGRAAGASGKKAKDHSSSDDETAPLKAKVEKPKKVVEEKEKEKVKKEKRKAESSDGDDDDIPLSKRVSHEAADLNSDGKVTRSEANASKVKTVNDDDGDDDVPLSKRVAHEGSEAKEKKTEKKVKAEGKDKDGKVKVVKTEEEKDARRKELAESKARREEMDAKAPTHKWWETKVRTDGLKWDYCEHKGVLFPPAYVPHGIKILYDGKPVALSPEEEEPATWFASMAESPYMEKEIFKSNFWSDWKAILGKHSEIKSLKKCNFAPIWEFVLEQKEKKKSMTSEEKKKIKLEKEALDAEYGFVKLDDHYEKIANYRVEPPGLFRGRGEHPKQGCIKKRIVPEDLTLNCSADAPIPPCPIPGHSWGKIQHDNKVTWLAMYKDSIMGETKYVFLSANSSFKGMSDFKKFEKARELSLHIDKIRTDYKTQLTSADLEVKQRATALYLIDKLALRVGGAKDEDEADTVGCCSLRTEHIKMIEEEEEDENGKKKKVFKVHFDFLGKDSIRYDQTHALEELPWRNLKEFKKRGEKESHGKEGGEVFDKIVPEKLNAYLRTLMKGLTAKVFRTYNASMTLDKLLQEDPGDKVQSQVVFYNRCNRDVAILCNHQRAKPKGFDDALVKVDTDIEEAEAKYKQAKRDYHKAKEAKNKADEEKYKRQVHLLKDRLEDKKGKRQTKIDLATVALGTSKINYLDPRISFAWCKKYGVPETKVFTKTLIQKFPWAMDVAAEWRFLKKDCKKEWEGAVANFDWSTMDDDDDGEDSGDEEDDDDTSKKRKKGAKGAKDIKAKAKPVKKAADKKNVKGKKKTGDESEDEKESEDSDDDGTSASGSDDDDVPLAKRVKVTETKGKGRKEVDSSDDDDVPLSKRAK